MPALSVAEIARHIGLSRSVLVPPERVLVTSGAQAVVEGLRVLRVGDLDRLVRAVRQADDGRCTGEAIDFSADSAFLTSMSSR